MPTTTTTHTLAKLTNNQYLSKGDTRSFFAPNIPDPLTGEVTSITRHAVTGTKEIYFTITFTAFYRGAFRTFTINEIDIISR